MDDSARNTYFSSGSSPNPRSRHHSTSDDQNILPHLLAPLPRETGHFQPYLGASENARNISVQFTGQGTTQLDSDILSLSFDREDPTLAVPPIVYPESSQRTTSHALSPYATDASKYTDFSSCGFATGHIDDASTHGTHTPRRGSWPPHPQINYPSWTQSPPRTVRSTASEPPESTSDESYSDIDEATQMSPMMSQFPIHSPQNVDLPPHHMDSAQALEPVVMTFGVFETTLRPVNDPEIRQTLRRPRMNIVADESEVTHPPPLSTFPSPSSILLPGPGLQGPSMRLPHGGQRQNRTNQDRVPVAPNSIPFPSPHSPSNVGDQRASGSKPKRSKMHQCQQCKKLFPRPSGLATHMNSHSGAKPYKCIVANCDKSFAVRSNAKRHLRTHGINPSSPEAHSAPRFTVGFEAPVVTQVHDAGRQPLRYRWITHRPSNHEGEWSPRRLGSSSSAMGGGLRPGLAFQTSMSSATSSTLSHISDEDYERATSSSAADMQHYQGDYNRSADEFPGSYPNYDGDYPRRG